MSSWTQWNSRLPSFLPLVVILSLLLVTVMASAGDRSLVYKRCLSNCKYINCLGVSDEVFASAQPVYLRWLQWGCLDECKYECMWQAVDAYEKDGSKIPQFHGKWPFIRLLGIQEPASVIASLLNFLSVTLGMMVFWKTVPSYSPMYFVWNFYGFVCLNAWFWSTIFHCRDLEFTERLDYFTALSLVMSSTLCFCLRFARTQPLWKSFIIPLPFFTYYVYHCYYLSYVNFNYSYNMTVNISFGLFSSAAWITWCAYRWKERPYVKRCILALLILNGSVIFEVFDFAPTFWVFDAHSLWHIGTVPVGYLWFSFAADDCIHISDTLKKKNKIL
ncbi:post-GPI attachment to proteins factor 3-like [Lineus longissimus]|uniref:post-GPI attachment to proteins factor 3-like n=1 Tax=Lineus longissimus TaxID=88925 RepID=UPI002B4CD503